MQIRKPKKSLEQAWHDYYETSLGYFRQIDKLIFAHSKALIEGKCTPHDDKTINECENLRLTFLKMKDDVFKHYMVKAKDDLLEEMKLNLNQIVYSLGNASLLLSMKYREVLFSAKSLNKIENYPSDSYLFLQQTSELLKEFPHVFQESEIKSIKKEYIHCATTYYVFTHKLIVFPFSLTHNKIKHQYEQSLKKSKKDKDILRQIVCIKELILGSHILRDKYIEILKSPDNYQKKSIDNFQDIFTRTCDYYKDLLSIIQFNYPSDELLKQPKEIQVYLEYLVEDACNDFIETIALFNEISNCRFLQKNHEQRQILLNLASVYFTVCENFRTQFMHEEKLPLKDQIENQIQIENDIIDQLNAEIQIKVMNAEIEKQQLEELKKEYNEKFSEILASFAEETPQDKTSKNKSEDKPSLRLEPELVDEDEDENIDEDNVYFVHESLFDLNFQIWLLNQAIYNNDIKEQILQRTRIAQHYYFQALALQNNHQNAMYITPILNLAMNYLEQIPNDANYFIKPASDVLIKINDLIQLLNEQQKRLELRYENGRECAKRYIIEKYGAKAWFKRNPNEICWDSLSENAKMYQITKHNVQVLTQMKYYTGEMSKKFEETIQMTNEKNKIEMPLIITNTFEKNAETKTAFANTYSPLLFKIRKRSCSYDSFLDPKEVEERSNKRKNYGRIS